MQLFRLIRFVLFHPLNKAHPWKAISRLLRWQIASRLLPEALIGVPFVNDAKLFMRRSMTGGTGNWYCGLHEIDDMGFVLHVLRPGDYFMDVGANIGSYSVLASAGAAASVIAIEPIPAVFEHLVANLRLNRLDSKVEAHGIGLSRNIGKLQFTTALDTVNHVVAGGEEASTMEIPVSTMDSVMAGRVPTIVKIDVEGYELAVLEGGGETLRAPGLLAMIIETNGSGARYGVNDAQLVALMGQYGFTPWSYSAVSRTLTPRHSFYRGNTIFLRNHSEVESRIKGAPRARLINCWL